MQLWGLEKRLVGLLLVVRVMKVWEMFWRCLVLSCSGPQSSCLVLVRSWYKSRARSVIGALLDYGGNPRALSLGLGLGSLSWSRDWGWISSKLSLIVEKACDFSFDSGLNSGCWVWGRGLGLGAGLDLLGALLDHGGDPGLLL